LWWGGRGFLLKEEGREVFAHKRDSFSVKKGKNSHPRRMGLSTEREGRGEFKGRLLIGGKGGPKDVWVHDSRGSTFPSGGGRKGGGTREGSREWKVEGRSERGNPPSPFPTAEGRRRRGEAILSRRGGKKKKGRELEKSLTSVEKKKMIFFLLRRRRESLIGKRKKRNPS